MDSLNVPLPPRVHRQLEALRPALRSYDHVRDTPTLVVKRFDGALPAATIESEVRLKLAETDPFTVALVGWGRFEQPVAGPSPVLYLEVQSPALERLHTRLTDAFGAIDGFEGEAYVPHVTVARGGVGVDTTDLPAIEPVEWLVSELVFWDPRRAESVGRIALES